MIQLGEHFGRDTSRRHSEWLRQQRWFIKAKQEQVRKDGVADKLDDDIAALAINTVMATDIQIRAFEAKLDAYDEATVTALMLNQEQIDAIDVHILDMLSRAYVMEDGRRVFLTEDRSQGFDEFGTEVTEDELNFDAVPLDAPTWEQRLELLNTRDQLIAERREVLEFQEKVDTAREKIAVGEISQMDLDALDKELAEAIPPSVARNLPNHGPSIDMLNAAPEIAKQADPDEGNVSASQPAIEPQFN